MTDDDWQREATACAVSAAQQVVAQGAINDSAMVSSLSEIEWGWIVCAAIFGWIEAKAKQAVAEGCCYEIPIRKMTHRDPAPWETGAIAAVLPSIADLKDIDWTKPVSEWSKDQIISFAWHAYRLTDAALAARDEGATDKIVRFCREIAEREHSAASGGPLMAHNEEAPFP